MRKNRKILAGLLVALTFMVSLLPASAVRAEVTDTEQTEKTERTYTVTFRAGNVGTFNTKVVESSDSVKVTENYVKFTVTKNESLPFESDDALYAYLQILTSSVEGEDGNTIDYIKPNYRLRPLTDWATTESKDGTPLEVTAEAICRNKEYVLDYVRLVNPVMYKITFIDTSSKEQVAAPIIAYGEAGETVECKFGSIANYAQVTPNGSIVLDGEHPEKNVYVFECVYTGDTGVLYVPGDTITNTVINEIPGAATAGVTVITPAGGGAGAGAGAAATPGGAGEAVIADEETPLAPGDSVEIADEETPLAPGETSEIGDEETPLAAGGEGNILWPYIVVIIIVVLAGTGVGVVIYRKKKIKKA